MEEERKKLENEIKQVQAMLEERLRLEGEIKLIEARIANKAKAESETSCPPSTIVSKPATIESVSAASADQLTTTKKTQQPTALKDQSAATSSEGQRSLSTPESKLRMSELDPAISPTSTQSTSAASTQSTPNKNESEVNTNMEEARTAETSLASINASTDSHSPVSSLEVPVLHSSTSLETESLCIDSSAPKDVEVTSTVEGTGTSQAMSSLLPKSVVSPTSTESTSPTSTQQNTPNNNENEATANIQEAHAAERSAASMNTSTDPNTPPVRSLEVPILDSSISPEAEPPYIESSAPKDVDEVGSAAGTAISKTTSPALPNLVVLTSTHKNRQIKDSNQTNSHLKNNNNRFGTQKIVCPTCNDRVYAMEEIKFEGKAYHRGCFKCSVCKGTLTIRNTAALNGKLFCKPHFLQMSSEGAGRYSFAKRDTTNKQTEVSAATLPSEITTTPVPKLFSEKLTPPPEISSKIKGTVPGLPEDNVSSTLLSQAQATALVSTINNKATKSEINSSPCSPDHEDNSKVEEKARSLSPAPQRSKINSPFSSPPRHITNKSTVLGNKARSLSPKPRRFGAQKVLCPTCKERVYPMEAMKFEGATYHKSCFKCSVCKGTLTIRSTAALNGKLFCKPHFMQMFSEGAGRYSFAKRGDSTNALPEETCYPVSTVPIASPAHVSKMPKESSSSVSPSQIPRPAIVSISPKNVNSSTIPTTTTPKPTPNNRPPKPVMACSNTKRSKTPPRSWVNKVDGPTANLKDTKSRSLSPTRTPPRFGAQKVICPTCKERVYPMEATKFEGTTYHKGCFKCIVCKGTLSIRNTAALNGKLFCKPHFMQMFSEGAGRYSFANRIGNNITEQ